MSEAAVRESAFSSGKQEARGERAVVATKHRLASAAALEMLRGGGNVADAAVAAAFAIGVVFSWSTICPRHVRCSSLPGCIIGSTASASPFVAATARTTP